MSVNGTSAPAGTEGMDRREFLRLSGTLAAAGALAGAGCQMPPEMSIPFHDMPESMVDGMGRARYFHTVLDGSPVLVKTREGRPILITRSGHDVEGCGLTVRHHAALMDLYDPDRARGPFSVRRGKGAPVAANWTHVAAEVAARLEQAGSRAVLLTGPVKSPALASVIAALTARSGLRHVVWSPLACDAAAIAWQHAFGHTHTARPRLDRADLIVGLGAEFVDRPGDGLDALFAARRTPDQPDGRRMSRFVQLEGRLTLTGANADRRIRIRDSHLALAGAALAHELIVVRRVGPLAGNARIEERLAAYDIDSVARRAGVDPNVFRQLADEMTAAPGRTLVIADGSADASTSGPAIELAALLLNVTLGAFDAGLLEEDAPLDDPTPAGAALATLAADMRAGNVDVLLFSGVNPVYDAPPDARFADALANVGYVVSLNDRIDETTGLADMLLPVSHPFECWSDAALPMGRFAVQQPVIQPLFDTRGLLDLLVEWAAVLGDRDAAAAADLAQKAATAPAPAAATAEPMPSPSVAYHYLRAAWAKRLSLDVSSPEFQAAWHDVLRAGVWEGPRPAAPAHAFKPESLDLLARADDAILSPGELELQLYPHLALNDGRSANNGWLHELPDPVTRLSWGGAVSIAPRRFDQMQLKNGDLVEIDTGHAKVVAPAYRHAGMHNDQIALPLGLGRTACGAIGNEVGVNAYPLRLFKDGRLIAAGLPASIRKVEGHEPLAFAQGSDVLDRQRRPLVPVTTLTAYERNPASGTEQPKGGPSAWPPHEYPNARWAMAIDLSKCVGCGKCVVACQAENNIPVVGRQAILDGREMSWLRIDRYYDAPPKEGKWGPEVWDAPLDVVEEPETLFQPMLCQHCENAPCETVCPFAATMHSEDGLNQQVYNRCVGTRYCANNCPFKVRRFNYFEYSKPQESALFRLLVPRIERNAELNTRAPMQMKNNPEVTVRSRGVMEKCSFCVQRIRAAAADAAREGRPRDHYPDGAVVPACMEACPTKAIVFGDINAPGSRVAELSQSPRAMKLLEALGVKPSISYLTKVRNDKA